MCFKNCLCPHYFVLFCTSHFGSFVYQLFPTFQLLSVQLRQVLVSCSRLFHAPLISPSFSGEPNLSICSRNILMDSPKIAWDHLTEDTNFPLRISKINGKQITANGYTFLRYIRLLLVRAKSFTTGLVERGARSRVHVVRQQLLTLLRYPSSNQLKCTEKTTLNAFILY